MPLIMHRHSASGSSVVEVIPAEPEAKGLQLEVKLLLQRLPVAQKLKSFFIGGNQRLFFRFIRGF